MCEGPCGALLACVCVSGDILVRGGACLNMAGPNCGVNEDNCGLMRIIGQVGWVVVDV